MHITVLDFHVFISLPSHEKLMSMLYFMHTPNRYAKKAKLCFLIALAADHWKSGNGAQEDRTMA